MRTDKERMNVIEKLIVGDYFERMLDRSFFNHKESVNSS